MTIGTGAGTNVGAIYYDVTLDTRQLVAERRRVESETEKAAAAFNAITRAVKVYATALALLKVAQLADDFRLLQARVNVASDSIDNGAKNFDRLRAISVSTRSSLESNVQVFTRLNPSIKQMGGNAQDTLRIVELLSKAITVSGASATEKSAAMIQFGQALGSGKLAGDELRSLLENAPYLMKQLADGLGVPIGQLKSLGEQGKLTADVVVNALTRAADRINKDFAQFPQTVGAAITVARDALARLIEKIDTFAAGSAALSGIASGTTKVLGALADMFDRAASSADELGRNREVEGWAKVTSTALSHVADAADVTWQALSVLGRNVGFVLGSVGREIGGIAAQMKLMQDAAEKSRSITDPFGSKGAWRAMQSDAFKGISEDLLAEGERRRKILDESDSKTLADRKLWGQQMRDEWAKGAAAPADPASSSKPSTLKSPVDPEEARKLAAKRAAAQAYYEGLLADTRTGLARIDAEEQKALQENARRAAADVQNAAIYANAKTLIVAKFARERALLEENYAKDRAAADIAVTTDEQERIMKIRDEAFRAADAEVKLGVKTFEQGENAKRVAAFQTGQALMDIADRNMRAEVERQVATTRNAEERIKLMKEETIRAAELALAMGKITQTERDAIVARANERANDETRGLGNQRRDFNLDTLGMKAAATGGTADNTAYAQAQAEAARAAALDAKERGIADEKAYAERILAINDELQARLYEIRMREVATLGTVSNAFGQLTDALRSETGKQDAIYRAAFIAQKAFAIASAIVNIQAGVAQAAKSPWPTNIAAMASVVAATASIIATIKGTNYGGGRQYGGPVSAGSMYRINETGRPEMFTAAGGAQYMLPTRDGRVTSADRAGDGSGGGAKVVHHHNNSYNITVPASTSRETAEQMAARLARLLAAASSRNN